MESTADGRVAFQARQSRSAVKNFQSWRVPKDRILKDTFTFSGTHCRVSAKIWQKKKRKKNKNIRDDAFSCHCTSAKRNPFTASLTFHDSNIGCLNSPYSGIFKYREALNSASLEPRLLRYNPEARLASLAIARGRLYFQSLPKRRKATVISSALRSSTSYRFLGEVYLNSRTPRRFIRTSGARLSLFLQFSSRGNAIFGVTSRVIRSALHRGKTKSRHEMRRLCGADRVAPVFGSLSLSLSFSILLFETIRGSKSREPGHLWSLPWIPAIHCSEISTYLAVARHRGAHAITLRSEKLPRYDTTR